MYGLLLGIHLLVCLCLVAVVLVQSGKGGGLAGGAFGNATDVTFGAGGSTRTRTLELVTRIRRELHVETMAHLTCVGSTREQLAETLDQMQADLSKKQADYQKQAVVLSDSARKQKEDELNNDMMQLQTDNYNVFAEMARPVFLKNIIK